MLKFSDLKTKETEEEIIVRKRSEYKKEYLKFLHIGGRFKVLKDFDTHKMRNDGYWEGKIQENMNRAQIALYNYDLLDPEILKLIVKMYLKEIIDKKWLLNLTKKEGLKKDYIGVDE